MEPLVQVNEVTPYDANISDDALGETECNNTMSDEEVKVETPVLEVEPTKEELKKVEEEVPAEEVAPEVEEEQVV